MPLCHLSAHRCGEITSPHTPVNRTLAKSWLENHWVRRNTGVTCAESNSHFGANIHCRLMHFFKCCRHWGSHPTEPSKGQGSSLGEALCGLGCTDAAPDPDLKVKSKTSAVRWAEQSAQISTTAAIHVAPAAEVLPHSGMRTKSYSRTSTKQVVQDFVFLSRQGTALEL